MYNYYSSHDEPSRVSIAGIHKDGYLWIGVSCCSPKDLFIKSVGRQIAEGRLKKALDEGRMEKIYKKIPMVECDGKKFREIAEGLVHEIQAAANQFERKSLHITPMFNRVHNSVH